MLSDSISIGREFSKFMITVATGSIPIYLSLVALLGVRESPSWCLLVPPGIFIAAVVLFVLAHFPRYGNFSLEIAEEIEAARLRAMSGRDALLQAGMAMFLIATALGAVVLIHEAAIESARSPRFEVVTVEVPQNADAKEVERRFLDFKAKLSTTKGIASMEIREIRTDGATLLVAIVRTDRREEKK